MRKYLLILVSVLCGNTAIQAQDIIVMRNGDEVQAKVAKVSSTEIEYKKWSNQDGPIYSVSKGDVFMIKYVNGEKDVFPEVEKQQNPQQTSNVSEPRLVEKTPAENNQELIDRYKTPVKFVKTPSTKVAQYYFPIMAMSDSSLVSTSDIEIRILPTFVERNDYYTDYKLKHSIELHNKTSNIIYVDLANCFRIESDGKSKCYFNTEQVTVNQGSSSGAGINLGGVSNVLGIGGALGTLAGATTVGGSNQSSVSKTYTNERILVIPPHSKKALTEYKEVNIKRSRYETISDIPKFRSILV